MNSLKQFFTDMKSRFLLVGVALVAIAAFVIDYLTSKNSGLQAQVDQVKDQKAADVLESKVTEELSDASLKQSQINANQQTLTALEEKRQELSKQKDLSAEEVQNYWKNN